MFNVPVYTHISNYLKDRKGGGVSILLNNCIPYKELEVFDEGKTELVLIEISAKNGKKIILGSLYGPPNTDENQFINHIHCIMTKSTSCKGKNLPEIVLGMDYNMDLLKSSQHKPTNLFLETLNELNLLPTITRPSHTTQNTATLINKILVSEALHQQFESTIFTEDISDHQPLVTMLKQSKILDKSPLTFRSHCLSNGKLKAINAKLMNIDWIGKLTGTTCDEKFEQFNIEVNHAMDEVSPIKTVCISAKRCYVELWMTRGLEELACTKLKLYEKHYPPKAQRQM